MRRVILADGAEERCAIAGTSFARQELLKALAENAFSREWKIA